jgi:hypothetical protein
MMKGWQITTDRYVGFFDIMGFRSMLNRFHPTDMYALMRSLHEQARHAELMARRIFQGEEQATAILSSKDSGVSLIKLIHFSDSTLAITRDDSEICSLAMTLVSHKLFIHALSNSFLLRGAIAWGQVTADFERSIFFGHPIVSAYELEEDQQWYGIVEHESVQRQASEGIQELGSDEIPLTEPFTVPLKSGARELTALNWPFWFESFDDLRAFLLPFSKTGSRKLNNYFRNTMSFGDTLWHKYRDQSPTKAV